MDESLILEIRSFVKAIVHHIPGRIRLRLSPEFFVKAGKIDLSAFQNLEGIKEIQVNPLALSAVITYDPDKLPPRLWEAFIKDEGSAAQVINQLLSGKKKTEVEEDG